MSQFTLKKNVNGIKIELILYNKNKSGGLGGEKYCGRWVARTLGIRSSNNNNNKLK